GESAQVVEIRDSGSNAKGYRQFVVTCKLSGEESAAGSTTEKTGEKQIRDALAPILQKDPVQVEVSGDTDPMAAKGELVFERSHPGADVTAALGRAGLTEAKATVSPGEANVFSFTGKIDKEKAKSDVAARIRSQLEGVKDTGGQLFNLRTPIPESSVVGPQV